MHLHLFDHTLNVHDHLRTSKDKNLRMIHTIHGMTRFALSLVSLFIPVFFLDIGYTFSQIILYYIFHCFAAVVFSPLVLFISNKTGIKQIFYIHIPMTIAFLWSLTVQTQVSDVIWFLGIFGGLNAVIYWLPIHTLFSRLTDKKKIGTQTSTFEAISRLSGTFAPFLGGLIAIFFGFDVLFLAAIIIIVFSFIPLMRVGDVKPHVDFSFDEFGFFAKKFPSYSIGESFHMAIREYEIIFWPIFVYLTFNSVIKVGLIGTFLALGAAALTIIVGRFYDRGYAWRLVFIGACVTAVVWVLRYYWLTSFSVIILSLLASIVLILIDVPFASKQYTIAKKVKHQIDEFILYREILINFVRIFILGLIYLFAQTMSLSLLLAAICAAALAYMSHGKAFSKVS